MTVADVQRDIASRVARGVTREVAEDQTYALIRRAYGTEDLLLPKAEAVEYACA